ncbi:vacuolar protein sorting-associated protein 13B-like, partial [Oncorhynchus tshawytscha]|uniref:vacuolar protein sorting-associated protein 13B-like n=1 Tax=Oncorhynchus tshawytscha TaxID=74940 RepID=UPI001C3DDE5B
MSLSVGSDRFCDVTGLFNEEPLRWVQRGEQQCSSSVGSCGVDSSSSRSGVQDSGFGSDSARIRIVQMEQQSGGSHHLIARPSRKSTVVKNLSFVPFDVFLTASKLSLMTYACSTLAKTPPASPEKKDGDGTTGKSSLNQPDTIPTSSSSPNPGPPTLVPLSGLTAEDLLNSNTVPQEPRGSLLSLDSLSAPSRSSARQALGVTIVRQPGRRGAGDRVLEPLLYLQVVQPSALLSCHHRKQRMDVSVFDVSLRGVSSDYKCLDPGKSLPEVLDYSVLWVQTVSGESDSQTGVPPPLACLQIRDFLSGPAELNVELSRPLKVNPTLVKLEQTKAYLKRVLPHHYWESPKPPLPLIPPPVSLRTAQIVVVMETESHPARPSLTWSVSAMKGTMNMKTGPKLDGAAQVPLPLLYEDYTSRHLGSEVPVQFYEDYTSRHLGSEVPVQFYEDYTSRHLGSEVPVQFYEDYTSRHLGSEVPVQFYEDYTSRHLGSEVPVQFYEDYTSRHLGSEVPVQFYEDYTSRHLGNPVQSVSVLLELQDILLRTGLKDRSRLLLGPFSCSAALEARWCRHSSSPEPETGTPKLLLDLKGGLLQ